METNEQPFFHGLLPREEVQILLQKNGDFLVRMSEPLCGQPRHLILSVMQNESAQEATHYVVRTSDGKFSITEKDTFGTLIELISHHKQARINEDIATSILINPIVRQSWELNHSDITLTKVLGAGAFGEVKLGTLKTGSEVVDVAIKVAKLEKVTKEQIKEITTEARLMRGFDHKNVVKCYGVAAIDEPLLVVMELVPGGALDKYLQKNTIQWPEKIDIISQVAEGIAYIHSKNVMHRDIAARNILYGKGVAKVSDFGLSRIGTEYQMDPNKRVPIRWLSPETLVSFLYTQQTDVFAFAILCWEVVENGTQPYPDMTLPEVHQKVSREDYRMPISDKTPTALADIIKKCWIADPQQRPSMGQAVTMMSAIASKKEVPVIRSNGSGERPKTSDRRRTSDRPRTSDRQRNGERPKPAERPRPPERPKPVVAVPGKSASNPIRNPTILMKTRRRKKRTSLQNPGAKSAMMLSPTAYKEKKKKAGIKRVRR